jgi:hypothetical protein
MRYFNLVIVTIIALIIFSCNGNNHNNGKDTIKSGMVETHTPPDDNTWIFDKVVDKTIYFKFNKKFTTNLYDLKYIGQLTTKNKAPFLILSGRGCDECDANISIYIHSPSDGPMKDESAQPRYGYPGKEIDYANGDLISESRMFYGDCLNNRNSVIWLQKTLMENGKFESSIFSAEIVDGKLKETSKVVDSLSLKNYIPKCKELPGTKFTSEP